jgi:hypothetical protein
VLTTKHGSYVCVEIFRRNPQVNTFLALADHRCAINALLHIIRDRPFTYILNRIEFAMRAAIAFEATRFALGAW